MLKFSGLTYTWDVSRPHDDRIVEVRKNGVPLDRKALYSVSVNEYLAAGGDNYSVLTHGQRVRGGPIDVDALITYLQSMTQPISRPDSNRISLLR